MDEAGETDAMGLGWVVMRPEDNRPSSCKRPAGFRAQFSYLAFAPTRGIGGLRIAINEFIVGAAST